MGENAAEVRSVLFPEYTRTIHFAVLPPSFTVMVAVPVFVPVVIRPVELTEAICEFELVHCAIAGITLLPDADSLSVVDESYAY